MALGGPFYAFGDVLHAISGECLQLKMSMIVIFHCCYRLIFSVHFFTQTTYLTLSAVPSRWRCIWVSNMLLASKQSTCGEQGTLVSRCLTSVLQDCKIEGSCWTGRKSQFPLVLSVFLSFHPHGSNFLSGEMWSPTSFFLLDLRWKLEARKGNYTWSFKILNIEVNCIGAYLYGKKKACTFKGQTIRERHQFAR